MPSADDEHLSIQDIINSITNLKNLTSDYAKKAGSNSGDVRDETKEHDGDSSQRKMEVVNSDGDNLKKEAVEEMRLLCTTLDHMIRSFRNLDEFQTDLMHPLKTLEANADVIMSDLQRDELPERVWGNLRALRHNITRVRKIEQQVAFMDIGDLNWRLQRTFATREIEDLPHLYGEDIFEKSYYFKEIEEKYESLDIRHKLCLLCFSIFPENAEIKRRILRHWWAGENLIPPRVGKDEKEVANDTLFTFVDKRLIEPVLKKNGLHPRSYKINPIVRSCLIRFAKKEGFFDYDQEGKPTMDFSFCNRACMVKNEGSTAHWFSEYLKGNENNTKSEKLSTDLLSLQNVFNFPDERTLRLTSRRFDKLQTLFNFSKQYPALPKEYFSKMKGLKVLYLGKWETIGAIRDCHIEMEDVDFLKGLKNMKNLRLLSLQGISGIRKIPSTTLGKLENLMTLDLRACHDLERLPHGIGSLKKLTYLDLTDCLVLDYIPKELGQLVQLQVLKGFVIVDVENSCTLGDLSNLENLINLSIRVNTLKFNVDAEETSLSKHQKLEKLKITWGSGGMPLPEKKDSTQDCSEEGQSKTKKQQESSAAKAENKGEDEGNEANSNTTKPEDNKNQNITRFLRPANVVLMATKLKSSGKGRKPQNPKGFEKLVKLELQCFPYSKPPDWLVPSKMVSLTSLSIRGGRLGYLVHEGDNKWNVDTLRLKFLMDFKMNWREMQERFAKLEYLEVFRSPGIIFCPCDARGVWQKSSE